VIVYSPMQAGLLTGKFTPQRVASLADNDWHKRSAAFTEPQLSANLELVDALRPIAARHEATLPQLAVAWVLRRPELTGAIVGARRPSQIEETVGAMDLELTAQDLAEIEDLLRQRDQALG
jgi:aryl-alcohol dehydrogenase-like predicted oxidoreductase